MFPAPSLALSFALSVARPASRTFVRVVATALLALIPGPAFAGEAPGTNPAAQQDSSRAFHGFFDYSPRVAQFQPALQPVVAPLEGNVPTESGQPIAREKHSAVRDAIARAEVLLKKGDRTFGDELHFLIGFGYELLGQHEKAADSYARSLSLKSTNVLVLFRNGVVLKRLGRCREAQPLFREVAWEAKSFAYEPNFLLGQCLEATGKTQEAEQIFNRVYQQNPKFVPVLKRLVLSRKKALDETFDPRKRSTIEADLVKDLDSLIDSGTNDRDLVILLASLLVNSGDPLLRQSNLVRGESLALSLAQQSRFSDEEAVHLLFEAQRKRGDLEAAEKTIKRGLGAIPKSARLRDDLKQLELEKSLHS